MNSSRPRALVVTALALLAMTTSLHAGNGATGQEIAGEKDRSCDFNASVGAGKPSRNREGRYISEPVGFVR